MPTHNYGHRVAERVLVTVADIKATKNRYDIVRIMKRLNSTTDRATGYFRPQTRQMIPYYAMLNLAHSSVIVNVLFPFNNF